MQDGLMVDRPGQSGKSKSAKGRTEQPLYAKLPVGTYQKLIDLRFIRRIASIQKTIVAVIEEKHAEATREKAGR